MHEQLALFLDYGGVAYCCRNLPLEAGTPIAQV
jgi:hypothetical protein